MVRPMVRPMVSLVPATEAHVRALYSSPLPVTVFGVAGVEAGRVLGLGALYLEQGCMVATCRFSDEAKRDLKRHTRAILIAARRLLAVAAKKRLPVRAIAAPGEVRAEALLAHLGFAPIENGVWEWSNRNVVQQLE